MEYKITNGDLAVDSSGRCVPLTSDEMVLQSAYIRIAAKKGKFFYNRELGSDVHSLDKNDKEFDKKFLFAVREAIVDLPDVKVDIVSKRLNRIVLGLTYRSVYRQEVIELNGNV